MSRSVIETHPRKSQIIEAILAGVSLRKIGAMAGVSHTVVDDYKHKVILPSLAKAAKLSQLEELSQAVEKTGSSAVVLKDLTKSVAAVSGSPLVAQWWERANRAHDESIELLTKAKLAQRVYKAKDGSEVYDGQDFSAPTGALNQLHRNLELTGRASGVLSEGSGGIHVDNMLVVMPRAGELPATPILDVVVAPDSEENNQQVTDISLKTE